MKSIIPIAVFLLLASGLWGDEMRYVVGSIPLRPGIPVAYVGDQRLMIVGYKGNDPVVLKNGSKTTVHDARVSIIPGETFAPGVVTIDSAQAFSQINTQQIDGQYAQQKYNVFEAKVTADRDLSDVFLILLEFEDLNGDYSDAPKVAILGVNIGHLAAGVKKSVDADFPPLLSKRSLRWVALVYTAGVQVHSGSGEELLSGLFDMLDHVGLQKVISARTYGSYPLTVYRRFPLKFDAEVKQKYAGQAFSLNVMIAPSGALDYVNSDSPGQEPIARELARQMGSWLFIPRIKDGEPLEGVVIVPLKF
jgi:hypothetical protein